MAVAVYYFEGVDTKLMTTQKTVRE